MDGGDRGAGQFGQTLEHLLPELDEIPDLAALVQHLQCLEVGAGRKRGLGRAQHQCLGRIDRHPLEQRPREDELGIEILGLGIIIDDGDALWPAVSALQTPFFLEHAHDGRS